MDDMLVAIGSNLLLILIFSFYIEKYFLNMSFQITMRSEIELVKSTATQYVFSSILEY
jgi:hypothetical protein